MNDIGPPYVGRSLLRREDRRLLTGQGQFIADLVLPQMLHAVLVRSPVAHARIRSVDLSRAAAAARRRRSRSTAPICCGCCRRCPRGRFRCRANGRPRSSTNSSTRKSRLLAHDKVRHVGEAIAIIVAETRDQAEDAAELVACDLEALPAVVDPEAALRPDSPIIHERYGTNLIGAFSVGRGEVDTAFATAPHRLQRRFYHHRYAAVPMECRGVVAAYDRRTNSATIWSSTQVVHWVRREAARPPGSARGAGPLHRARCRRRLWRQGPCLPRRPADHLPRAQNRPAGALDRGPKRAFDERDPFARPIARCRGRL